MVVVWTCGCLPLNLSTVISVWDSSLHFQYREPCYIFLLCSVCHCWQAGDRSWPCLTGSGTVRPKYQLLYQHIETHCFWLSIGSRHLQEGVHFSNGRNILRYEGLELGVEFGQHRGIPRCDISYLWIVLNSSLRSPLTGRLAYWAGSYAPSTLSCAPES